MGVSNLSKLHTLDFFSFPFTDLNKEWGCDKRYGMDALQRFLFLNQCGFDFLNIKADIEIKGNDPYLKLQTSQYAGSIPLLSPKDGKPCGDLGVGGRFGEDISELLSIVGETLLPQYEDTLPPLTTSILEPPLYFECCNFIDKWFEVERTRWHKFNIVDRIEHAPTNGTRWDIYGCRSYDPANTFRYPNRANKLKPLHKEFCEMISVLWICFGELKKPQVPMRSRTVYANKVSHLQVKYPETVSLPVPAEFIVHASDPIAVKEAKQIANIILHNKRTNKRAWRINYSEFFERFVQYVFGEIAKSRSAKVICNPHYSITGAKPTWALQYLEPDLIVQKNDIQYVADAKYKSHMFNWNETGDELRETFRHDLHQILAYCSFNAMSTKKALLVYPFGDFALHKQRIGSPVTKSEASIYLIGIPLAKSKIEEVKEKLKELIIF